MKDLIYSTRPLAGKFVHSLLQLFKFTEQTGNKKDILLMTKTDDNIPYIESVSKIQLNPVRYYTDFYHNEVVHMKNWEEAYEKIDVSHLKDYSHLFLFGGILSDSSGLKRGKKRSFNFPVNDRGQINFLSVGVYLLHTLALLKANREFGIPLIEVVYDTQEVSLNQIHPDFRPRHDSYYLIHNYDIEDYSINRVDMIQYFYDSEVSFFVEDTSKDLDFVFGFTVITKERLAQLEKFKAISDKFENSKLFIHNKIGGESTFIPRTQYLDFIRRSKYTLIIPPYDVKSISIFRILEAINLDCIPLIHSDCNVADLEKSFDIDLSEIIVDSDWKPFTEQRRNDIIAKLKEKFKYRKGLFDVVK